MQITPTISAATATRVEAAIARIGASRKRDLIAEMTVMSRLLPRPTSVARLAEIVSLSLFRNAALTLFHRLIWLPNVVPRSLLCDFVPGAGRKNYLSCRGKVYRALL
jgi:hypothetical protein